MGKRKGTRWKSNPPPELAKAGYLATAAAAALMGVSTRTFYDLVNDGLVPCWGVGRSHLFKRDEVIRARRELYGR